MKEDTWTLDHIILFALKVLLHCLSEFTVYAHDMEIIMTIKTIETNRQAGPYHQPTL